MSEAMTCARIGEVRAVWEGEGAGTAGMNGHLRECATCRAEWDALERYRATLLRMDVATPMEPETRDRMKRRLLDSCATSRAVGFGSDASPVLSRRGSRTARSGGRSSVARVRLAVGLSLATAAGALAGFWATRPPASSPPDTVPTPDPALTAVTTGDMGREHRYIVRQTLWVLGLPQSITAGPVRVEVTKARVLRIMPRPMTPELYVMAKYHHMHTSRQEQDLLTRLRIMESMLDFERRNWKVEEGTRKGEAYRNRKLEAEVVTLSKQLARLKAARERLHPVPKPTPAQLAAARKAIAAAPPPHPLSQSLEVEGKLYPAVAGPVWAEQTYITRSLARQGRGDVNGSRFVRLTPEGVDFHGGWPTTKENLAGKPARLFIQVPVTQHLPTRSLTFPVTDRPTRPENDLGASGGGDAPWSIRITDDNAFGPRRNAKPGTTETRMLTFRAEERAETMVNPVNGRPVELHPAFKVDPPWRLHMNSFSSGPGAGRHSVTYMVGLEGRAGESAPPVNVRFVPSSELKGTVKLVMAEFTLPWVKG